MTTFNTKNQSRKHHIRMVMISVCIAALVIVIIFSSKNAQREKYLNKLGRKSRFNSNSIDDLNELEDDDKVKQRQQQYYASDSVVDQNLVRIATNGGPIMGQIRLMPNGKKIANYLSVPYAAAPVANLRFETPRDKESWNKTLEAFYQPPSCSQVKIFNNEFDRSMRKRKSLFKGYNLNISLSILIYHLEDKILFSFFLFESVTLNRIRM